MFSEYFNMAEKNPTAFIVAGAGVVVLFVVYKLFDFVNRKGNSDDHKLLLQGVHEVARVMREGAFSTQDALERISARLDRLEEDLWKLKNQSQK